MTVFSVGSAEGSALLRPVQGVLSEAHHGLPTTSGEGLSGAVLDEAVHPLGRIRHCQRRRSTFDCNSQADEGTLSQGIPERNAST